MANRAGTSIRLYSLAICRLLVVICYLAAATSAQTCPPNQPPCRNDTQQPMAGHGPAYNLPPELCSNCQGDDRRVIIIRIDSSWNVDSNGNSTPGITNAYIWNAVQCAVNQWNTVKAPDEYTTGYRLVVDQEGRLPGAADITITRQQVTTASGAPRYAGTTSSYPYTTKLSPANGNLGSGKFTSDDLCGRIAHELGHPLGLSELFQSVYCNSIMIGVNPSGTRDFNQVSPMDVYQVNRNLDPATRSNGYCKGTPEDNTEENIACNSTIENNCYADGGSWDSNNCTCSAATGCDQTQATDCYNNGGNWDDTSCSCAYPQYYYSGGPTYYCYYEQHCYYTMASDGDSTEYSEMECYWEQKGCWYSY